MEFGGSSGTPLPVLTEEPDDSIHKMSSVSTTESTISKSIPILGSEHI